MISMAQFTVRNLEDDVRDKLKELAQRHGHSMEEEVRTILRAAVTGRSVTRTRLGSRLARRFGALGLRIDIHELRGHPIEPLDLDQ